MENTIPEDENDEGFIDKVKKATDKLAPKFGNTGSQKEYAKNPLAVVGFWLMTALATVLGLMYFDKKNEVEGYKNRADEAEKLVVIERAKRDADGENYNKRAEYWINKAIETIKESAKREQLQELNK